MKNRLKDALLSMAGEIHPDDGVDPSALRRDGNSGRREKPRKLQALCKQMEQGISMAIPARLDLTLISVSPGSDASTVVALFQRTNDRVSYSDACEALDYHSAFFRQEAAKEISRRRVPDIIFQVSPIVAP